MIIVALGANLPSRYGSPEETLKAAQVELTRRGVEVVQASSIWLSAPVPVSDQPWYRNGVVHVQSDLEPLALLKVLKEIERDFGRAEAVRNAPRVLDLDIIAYHDDIIEEEGCIVPHPRLQSRAFVLYPLREVAGEEWIHPVTRETASEMIENLPRGQEIKKLGEEAA